MGFRRNRVARWYGLPWVMILGLEVGGRGAVGAGTELFTFHETNVLGTSMDLVVNAPNGEVAKKAHDVVMAEVEGLRKVLSTYDAESDLGKVNAGKEAVKVSPDVITVLKMYEEWSVKSKGAFSARLGEMVEVWRKAETDGNVPGMVALTTLANASRKPLWKIDEAAGTVTRVADGKINVDSLGKGFIISRVAAAVKEKMPELRGLMLNIGGDIMTIGTPSATGDEPWEIRVADPEHPAENAEPLTTLKLSGMSVATSGDYERGFKVGGQTYSHIINPRNGYPVNYFGSAIPKSAGSVSSVTVVAPDNAVANALATTLNVISVEDGFALVKATPGAEALIVLKDGAQLRSKGFERLERGGDVAAAGWADGSRVEMTLEVLESRDRPYVAVWVEDQQGEHVVTLAEWGNNGRYITSLFIWMREAGLEGDQIMRSGVSRATRPAGVYKLSWDGKDQKGQVVPAGKYRICVEFNTEHNGHSSGSVNLMCAGKEGSAVVKGTQHFADMTVSYVVKK